MTRTPTDTDLQTLKNIVGDKGWSSDDSVLAPHLCEWRGKYHGTTPVMLMPKTTEEVSAVLQYCNSQRLAVLPQGGNTGLVGGSTPGLEGRSEILLSTKRMRGITDIDTRTGALTAWAGTPIAEVQAAAEGAGRLFPLSLASEGSCTVGGTIATNAGGVHVIRYGTMGKLIHGLEIVLADGQIISELTPLPKNNQGYHFNELFAGSEGSLGVITRASLKLFAPERYRTTAWLAVEGLSEAVTFLENVTEHWQAQLSVFEVISDEAFAFVLRHIEGARAPVERQPWYILLELGSATAALDTPFTDWLADQMRNGTVLDAAIAQSHSQRAAFWRLRESLSEAQKLEGKSIKHDIALAVHQIPTFHARAKPALEAAFPGCRVTPFGHLGDGNLHYNVMQPENADGEVFARQWNAVSALTHELVREFGGSIAAEHGVGTMKRAELAKARSASSLHAMHAIKQAMDPNGILAPGQIFEGMGM